MTELTKEQKKELSYKYADQVANALRGKFTDCKVFVREIEAPEFNYIEMAVKRAKDNMEWTVAYSDEFFYEMTDAALKQDRAKRIFKDLKIHMGIHD